MNGGVGLADFEALARGRASTRSFRDESVPRELVRRLLAVATRAPSAHNAQPWRFAVVGEEGSRVRLAEAMGADFRRDLLADGLPAETVAERVRRSRALITRAPVGVVLCLSMEGMERYPDEGRRACELAMAEQSVALAGGHLLLAAHAAGLAGVWLCAPLFCPDSVTRALHLPLGWEPRALLLLGYPDGEPQLTPRKGVEQVTVWR